MSRCEQLQLQPRNQSFNIVMMSNCECISLQMFRKGRGLQLDSLAAEQAILSSVNDTDLSDDDAASINAASFKTRGERNFFKNQYRRHARNIAQHNPFYGTETAVDSTKSTSF